jgi:hypothetical protein
MLTQSELKDILNYNHDTGIFTWKVTRGCVKNGDIAGTFCKDYYLQISIGSKKYLAHRLAWLWFYGRFPKEQLDHINCNRSDNSILNLREVTNSQNQQNQRLARVNNHTGFLGVSFDKLRKKFKAQIKVNKKNKHVGYFDCPKKAHEAYLKAKRQLHEFCTI